MGSRLRQAPALPVTAAHIGTIAATKPVAMAEAALMEATVEKVGMVQWESGGDRDGARGGGIGFECTCVYPFRQ